MSFLAKTTGKRDEKSLLLSIQAICKTDVVYLGSVYLGKKKLGLGDSALKGVQRERYGIIETP